MKLHVLNTTYNFFGSEKFEFYMQVIEVFNPQQLLKSSNEG